MNGLDIIRWVEDWYTAQCDGDWEHQYGVKISTVDNPGWIVEIDLNETRYDKIQNQKFVDERSPELDWIICEIKDAKFIGHGGSKQLERMLQVFPKWIENY